MYRIPSWNSSARQGGMSFTNWTAGCGEKCHFRLIHTKGRNTFLLKLLSGRLTRIYSQGQEWMSKKLSLTNSKRHIARSTFCALCYRYAGSKNRANRIHWNYFATVSTRTIFIFWNSRHKPGHWFRESKKSLPERSGFCCFRNNRKRPLNARRKDHDSHTGNDLSHALLQKQGLCQSVILGQESFSN